MPIAVAAMVWLVAVVAALTCPRRSGLPTTSSSARSPVGVWYVAVLRRRLADGTAGLVAKVDA